MGSSSTKTYTPETENFVQQSIASDKVVIFSKQSCPYCSMAKKVKIDFKTKEFLMK